MIQETNVSPAEETQNPSAELAETPEVANPENVESTEQNPAPEKSEESDVERERKRFQRRIDRRTAELYRERAEREALAQRLAQYEQQPREEAGKQPDPMELAREIAARERFDEKCNAIAEQGSKKFKDFDAALRTVAAEAGPLFDGKGKPTPLMQVVMEAEAPAAVLHYLGTNPDLAADLADLSPTQLARRLDRIEREMADAGKASVSSAPRPLTPVKASGSATKDPSQMTDAEYRAWRLANK
jgi:hypothetical protein